MNRSVLVRDLTEMSLLLLLNLLMLSRSRNRRKRIFEGIGTSEFSGILSVNRDFLLSGTRKRRANVSDNDGDARERETEDTYLKYLRFSSSIKTKFK